MTNDEIAQVIWQRMYEIIYALHPGTTYSAVKLAQLWRCPGCDSPLDAGNVYHGYANTMLVPGLTPTGAIPMAQDGLVMAIVLCRCCGAVGMYCMETLGFTPQEIADTLTFTNEHEPSP